MIADAIRNWWRGLASAAITGLATSFLSSLGISGAQIVGVQIDQLNLKQLAVVTVLGGLVGAAAYLKQSPLPPNHEN